MSDCCVVVRSIAAHIRTHTHTHAHAHTCRWGGRSSIRAQFVSYSNAHNLCERRRPLVGHPSHTRHAHASLPAENTYNLIVFDFIHIQRRVSVLVLHPLSDEKKTFTIICVNMTVMAQRARAREKDAISSARCVPDDCAAAAHTHARTHRHPKPYAHIKRVKTFTCVCVRVKCFAVDLTRGGCASQSAAYL